MTTGTFLRTDQSDNEAPYSGTVRTPNFPGEDFLQNACTGLTFPTNLQGSTVIISIEPLTEDNPLRPGPAVRAGTCRRPARARRISADERELRPSDRHRLNPLRSPASDNLGTVTGGATLPEGHTIHRYARLHRAALGGKRIRVGSPQGRFAAGAARLDGATLDQVDAHGKHLFYRWDNGETLHVHLGLFGRFRTFRDAPPPPTEGTRLAMEAPDVTIYLAGPTICDLIDPEEEDSLRARLGPDPIGNRRGQKQFAASLSKRRIPIGAALLDQRIVAGVGNVYRAEILFLAGISPHRPAHQLSPHDAEELWSIAAEQLRLGEKAGRIVTVEPTDVGARRRSDLLRFERLYVYKRDGEPCRRCNTEIAIGELANRKVWWCPTCQPR